MNPSRRGGETAERRRRRNSFIRSEGSPRQRSSPARRRDLPARESGHRDLAGGAVIADLRVVDHAADAILADFWRAGGSQRGRVHIR